MAPKSKRRVAWILTAPKGKKRIPGEILLDIGLEFPNAYEAVGKVRTGHRNEEQVLWQPLNIIPLET